MQELTYPDHAVKLRLEGCIENFEYTCKLTTTNRSAMRLQSDYLVSLPPQPFTYLL
jgi:hypothetical protein